MHTDLAASPSLVQYTCSIRLYRIRPTPKDGSMTFGVYSLIDSTLVSLEKLTISFPSSIFPPSTPSTLTSTLPSFAISRLNFSLSSWLRSCNAWSTLAWFFLNTGPLFVLSS